MPGLQALRILRQRDHPQRGCQSHCPHRPQTGVLRPLCSCRQVRSDTLHPLCQLAKHGQSGEHRAYRAAQSTSAVHGSADTLQEIQEVRCRQSHTHARQHVLSHTVLRSSFQRQVVRHQAAHRSGKGSEAPQLRAHQVPHRDCQLLLEQHLQGRGHYRSCQAAGACLSGEGQYHQLPHRHGEQRKGALLHVLCFTERRGATRRCHQQDRDGQGGWRLGDRHHRGGKYDVLHDASPLQPRRLGTGQVADQ